MAVQTSEKYCPICGKQVTEPTFNRFGERACSEAHADEYVKEARDQKTRAAAPVAEQQPQRPPRQMCGG